MNNLKKYYYKAILATIAITILSWIRFIVNEYQLPLFQYNYNVFWGLILYISFVFALIVQYGAFSKIIDAVELFNYKFFGLILMISCLQLPFLSNDIFSYFYYGKIANLGSNPSLLSSLQPNFFSSYVDPIYLKTISMYGSVSIAFLKGNVSFPFESIFAYLILYRLAQILIVLLLLFVVKKLGFENNSGLKMCMYNPIFLTLCIGQFHIEWLGYILVLLGVLFYLKERLVLSILCIILAVFVKFSFLFFLWLPFILFLKNKNIGALFLGLISSFLALYAINVYAEVSFLDFFSSMSNLQKMRPSGTWHDIATFIISLTRHSSSTDANVAVDIYTQFSNYFKIIAVSLFFALVYRAFRTNKLDKNSFLTITLFCLIVFISNRIFSWYFILILPLFLLKENMNLHLKKWLYISSFLYILSEASLIVPQKNIADILVVVFMIFAILYGFFTYFKLFLWFKKS